MNENASDGHTPGTVPGTVPRLARFFAKVERGGDCWIWTGAHNGKYGRFYWSPQEKNEYAHRASYRMFVGAIAPGMQVCHHCDTPLCVNPSHLFQGTDHDNALDALLKNRTAFGEKMGSSKLTWDRVREIREANPTTELEISEFSRRFGVSRRTIYRVLLRETWVQNPIERAFGRPDDFQAMIHPETREIRRVSDDRVQLNAKGFVPIPPELDRAARVLVSRRSVATVSRISTGKMSKWLNDLEAQGSRGDMAA